MEPEQEGAFEVRKDDLVMTMPGAGIVLTYEVARVVSNVDIPPYTRRMVFHARDDLTQIPGITR